MEGFHLKSFEVKTSKTGLSVPVVNNVHLHSAYDPIKEAQSLIEKHRDTLRSNSRILVFGLGYGYHIELLVETLKQYHKRYEVIVIEPVHEVFEGCRKLRRITDNNISIYAGHKIEKLYGDTGLAEFMSRKPAIIAHPASMNLHSKYFKDFMTFSASDFLVNISSQVETHDMKRSFERYNPSIKYDDFVGHVRNNKNKFYKTDYLILALEEMSK